MFKKGDTLIEVMLAIGIFSMIAIAITAVMSSGSSGAQTALETTLAREEIDTQAEAIRFIQTSYAIDKNAADDTYAKLWKEITKKAVNLSNSEAREAILQYEPTSCNALYDKDTNPLYNNAFVINPRELSTFSADAGSGGGSQTAIVTMDSGKLLPTTTYPRLVFGTRLEDDNGSLVGGYTGNDLLYAEGLYVVAVKDSGTTNVVDAAGQEKDSGFYDFYIRSCWYGSDADVPTTISTVIRLYDPDAITTAGLVKVDFTNPAVTGIFPPGINASNYITKGDTNHKEGRKATLPTVKTATGWDFVWKNASSGVSDPGKEFDSGAIIANEDSPDRVKTYLMTGHYTHTHYKITYVTDRYPDGYNTSGIAPFVISPNPQECYQDNRDDAGNPVECILNNNVGVSGNRLTASGYRMVGWCSSEPTYDGSGRCDGQFFKVDKTSTTGVNINDAAHQALFTNYFNKQHEMTLYPVWTFNDEVITIKTEWTSDCSEGRSSPYGCDYDSYMKLQKPGSTNDYIEARYNTRELPVTIDGKTYSLVTGGAGDGRGSINNQYYETFEIHTLGGKNYYYSVKNWTNPPGIVGDDITVTVSGPYTGTYTFRSDHLPSSSCKYWNVFAYIDGEIYERNTCTNSTEIWNL